MLTRSDDEEEVEEEDAEDDEQTLDAVGPSVQRLTWTTVSLTAFLYNHNKYIVINNRLIARTLSFI